MDGVMDGGVVATTCIREGQCSAMLSLLFAVRLLALAQRWRRMLVTAPVLVHRRRAPPRVR